ncbi:hypothetical protein [Streptomyces sp. NPDC052496]|uniref:hypothetical protein n=1 Tax=Streptomyces sp. NPDC052496 TaxID=3154951 RepID=UPI0034212519
MLGLLGVAVVGTHFVEADQIGEVTGIRRTFFDCYRLGLGKGVRHVDAALLAQNPEFGDGSPSN